MSQARAASSRPRSAAPPHPSGRQQPVLPSARSILFGELPRTRNYGYSSLAEKRSLDVRGASSACVASGLLTSWAPGEASSGPVSASPRRWVAVGSHIGGACPGWKLIDDGSSVSVFRQGLLLHLHVSRGWSGPHYPPRGLYWRLIRGNRLAGATSIGHRVLSRQLVPFFDGEFPFLENGASANMVVASTAISMTIPSEHSRMLVRWVYKV